MDRLSNEIVLLEAVARRLIESLGLDDRAVKIALPEQIPPDFPARTTRLALRVVPVESKFLIDEEIGGGAYTVLERIEFDVVICSLDALPGAEDAVELTVSQHGLFAVKRSVLAALAGWDPVDASGTPIAASHVLAISCGSPKRHKNGVITLPVRFAVDLGWDIDTSLSL